MLSEKIAKRTFVYSLSFEWIKRALDVLLGEISLFLDYIIINDVHTTSSCPKLARILDK